MSGRTADTDRERAAAAELARRVVARERAAIARALTEVERLSALAPPLVAALVPQLGRALVVGITGPPGAGKSTLVNALIGTARAAGRTVGVLAVDPSSPVSGGAILGDRIRMTAAHADDGVFVRSLASRGHLGGLSPAAVRMIDVLDAAGFGLILIETVGTGQSEIDVAEIADVRVVVAAPGLGDGIQAMKSGLIEIADVMVVNKADRDGAAETAADLAGALALRAGLADVPVLLASATEGRGIGDVAAAVDRIGEARLAVAIAVRRRRRARYLMARAAAELVRRRIRDGEGGAIDQLADEILAGLTTADKVAARLLAGG